MSKKSKSILVAEYFIWKNKVEPQITGMSKLKLQKLLYYAQAWNLVFNNGKLFEDKIEAWIHGPAILKVYIHFKDYNFKNKKIKFEKEDFKSISTKEKELLDDIWKVYGKFDGSYLETLTHNELPWQKARGEMEEKEPSQNVISLDVMKDFYAAKIKVN